MSNLVNQVSQNPTNKLSAAVIAAAVVSLSRAVTSHFWPEFADQSLWDALLPIAVYLAGYFVRDEATVVVTQNVVATDVIMPEQSDA